MRHLLISAVLCSAAFSDEPAEHGFQIPRVHCVHADSIPILNGDYLVELTHSYISIIDCKNRQAAWVAYHVQRHDFDTNNVLTRNFHTPRRLREVCLEQGDFHKSGYDIGHAYALASVAASPHGSEVNSFGALFAQTPGLNRGPWRKLEAEIRELAQKSDIAVQVGQLWVDEMRSLKNADEPHAVASHNWIWFYNQDRSVNRAYLFPQALAAVEDDPEKYRTPPAKLRKRVAKKWWQPADAD